LNEGADRAPHGDAGPQALLDTVLAALQGDVHAGAAALFAALTPRARGPLGGEAGLARALANAWLAPLVATTEASVEPWDHRGDAARTVVAVDGPHGPARFLVSARREDGGWRLTGVRRDDLPLA
jgi:hypothetical protein